MNTTESLCSCLELLQNSAQFTRQAKYVLRNTEARPCNQWWSGKTKSVPYSECVFVAWSVKHAMRNIYCHLWPAWHYHIFPCHDFREKVSEHKMCTYFDFLKNFHLKHFSFYEDLSVPMWSIRHSCQILTSADFSRQIFGKYTNIKFNENPSKWELSCLTQMDRQTDRHDGINSRFSLFCESV